MADDVIDAVHEQIKTLGEVQFHDLLVWMMHTERARRQVRRERELGRVEMVKQLRESGDVAGPAAADRVLPGKPVEEYPAWEDPCDEATCMYVAGNVVAHEGRVWESEFVGLNGWEPGVDNPPGVWRDATQFTAPVDAENTAVDGDAPDTPAGAQQEGEQ